MIVENIKHDIKIQILKADKAFTNNLGQLHFEGLLSEDVDTLSEVLKKVILGFQVYRVLSIVISAALAAVSLLKYFDSIDSVNLNKAGIFIIMTIVFLVQTSTLYKVKVNLENKIYLLDLLKKMDGK